MTMIDGQCSSATIFEQKMPMPIIRQTPPSSHINPDVQNLCIRQEVVAWPSEIQKSDMIRDHTMISTVNVASVFDFDRSSAVFTAHGLARTAPQAYWARISDLRRFAAEDGCCLSHDSELDFWDFVKSEPRLRKGELILMDNGNLRSVWKDSQGTRLAVQFLGGGMVQYVVFKKRETMRKVSRAAGCDTFAGLKRLIDAFEIHSLLYG